MLSNELVFASDVEKKFHDVIGGRIQTELVHIPVNENGGRSR